MDSVETEAHAVLESARSVPQREPEAPDFHVEQRPSLERLASGIGNRGMGQLVARMETTYVPPAEGAAQATAVPTATEAKPR